MTIAIFIYSMSGGGAERVVSYLLPYLKNHGHIVHLVLMNSMIAYDIPENIPVHYLEKSRPFESGIFKLLKLPFLAYKYARLSKKLGLTHSFSLLSRPNYVNVLMRFFSIDPPKVIISERNYASMQYGYKDSQSKINNFLVRRLYPKADLVIGNSQANVEDLVHNYGIDRKASAVIQNPIDLETIDKIGPIQGFFTDDYFNVITVGRFAAAKNHELLINAVSDVPQARLYILGAGPLEQKLKQMVVDKKLGERIIFLGFDNNPYKYLKSTDLFIFGSNHEGFPNVILEAMSCGLPILTTDCKSGPNEILQLKKSVDDNIMKTPYGILSPVGSVELMTKGLKHFLQNPDYLESCRENVLVRIRDFRKDEILRAYESTLVKAQYKNSTGI